MKIIKKLTFATLAAQAVALLFQTPITRAGDHGQKGDHDRRSNDNPRQITFQKCWDEATQSFIGTVAGDCGVGTVVAKFLSVPQGATVVHFAGEYTITTSECSIKTVCGGIWTIATGHIVLNGVVTEGPYLGDQVHVRAQATDGGACSHGTMTITPSERE